MDKREAYRICHVYPDAEIPFKHEVRGVIYDEIFRRLTPKECETYFPFTVETSGNAWIADSGKVTCIDIGRRYRSMEDAVVHIFNGRNENANVINKYSCLEDILFG